MGFCGTPLLQRTTDTAVPAWYRVPMPRAGYVAIQDCGREVRTDLVVLGVLLLSLISQPGAAQQLPTSRMATSGVYSVAQARRGEAAYRGNCTACHGVDLRGSEGGKPLMGRAFRSSLLDRAVGDLYEQLRETMPEDNPGALPRAAYVDLIAYLLEVNGYPAGAGDLIPDTAALNRIQINRRPDGR